MTDIEDIFKATQYCTQKLHILVPLGLKMKGADTPYYARGIQLQKRTDKGCLKECKSWSQNKNPKKIA